TLAKVPWRWSFSSIQQKLNRKFHGKDSTESEKKNLSPRCLCLKSPSSAWPKTPIAR
ncbi:unnamed protein product, partial [Ilex paraguariensis]